ncbi:MAG TPA: flagellar biosynthesis anti-sigma factor FlgM [Steroidobacteraceae bacterium]|nr:flagellar biosynthesis anti-sigma factor FlgM [Steroidobacteraceae bacterium]
MSGKISGVTNGQPASATAAASNAGQQRAVANASAAPGGTTATDSVQITDTASYLVTAEQALSDVPVVNAGRVAEISDSLAAGTYEISPQRIANQLLQFERLLPEESAE